MVNDVASPTMAKRLTVSDAVDRLGGTTAVAEIFGVVSTAVSNWRAANRVSGRYELAFYRLCKRRRVPWDPQPV